MTAASRYREFAVSGSPRDMGRQIGDAMRDEIRGFREFALAHAERTLGVRPAEALALAEASIAPAQDYAPAMVEELRGMAQAARLSLTDLMLLQVRNQLRAKADAGCTSLALSGQGGQRAGSLVAQNWDNEPGLDAFTVVLTRRPTGKPAQMTLTQAGLIAYIGFNEAGIGLCLNSLPAPARELGVPHYFTVRGILESTSLDEAIHAVRRAERAIPANIMLATPQGPADLEVTIDDVHVLGATDLAGLAHTNHGLHPKLAAINERFSELIQSHARSRRIESLLALSTGCRPTLAEIQAALRDHDGYPRSICRHANDDVGTGAWQTVFSVAIETDARRMHVARGNPCVNPFETYELS